MSEFYDLGYDYGVDYWWNATSFDRIKGVVPEPKDFREEWIRGFRDAKQELVDTLERALKMEDPFEDNL